VVGFLSGFLHQALGFLKATVGFLEQAPDIFKGWVGEGHDYKNDMVDGGVESSLSMVLIQGKCGRSLFFPSVQLFGYTTARIPLTATSSITLVCFCKATTR
jgi:hypothetical protein